MAQWRYVKQMGFSDSFIASLQSRTPSDVTEKRIRANVLPTFKTVDTCAAEFEASTPYHYSTWEDESEVRSSPRDRVIILGSGPNRIGQGIEFDYCCVHASLALREQGFETVMVNCNPETVSTDYTTSDRLYFEPLTSEDLENIIAAEQAACTDGATVRGVIVSLGGQTPLKLAAGIPSDLILGTPVASIDAAEDRNQWSKICRELGIAQPPGDTATTLEGAREVAKHVGYPVLVRPSYVLGGRAMEIVYDEPSLREYFTRAVRVFKKVITKAGRMKEIKASQLPIDGVTKSRSLEKERPTWRVPDSKFPEREAMMQKYGWHGISAGIRLQPTHHVETVIQFDRLDQNYLKLWLDFIYAGMYVRGILDDKGRPMVLINWNTDMGDGVEWSNAQEYPGYIKWTALAYQMLINEVIYSLTH